MLRIRATVDASGVLRTLTADGHAGLAARGQDPACAAASVLLLTAARTIEASAGFVVGGQTERPGSLQLEVVSRDGDVIEYGRGITDMLLKGVGDLAAEYPDHVRLTISKETEEKTQNGT